MRYLILLPFSIIGFPIFLFFALLELCFYGMIFPSEYILGSEWDRKFYSERISNSIVFKAFKIKMDD